MLTDPDIVEAQILSTHGVTADQRGRGLLACVRQMNAKLHGPAPQLLQAVTARLARMVQSSFRARWNPYMRR
jgi:hypothetical protein